MDDAGLAAAAGRRAGAVPPATKSTGRDLSPVGALAAAAPVLEPAVVRFGEAILEAARDDPQAAACLDLLSDDEQAHLKVSHVSHLRLLVAPETTDDDIVAQAERAGRAHAMIRLDGQVYTSALSRFRQVVVEALDGWASPMDRVTVVSAVDRRLFEAVRGHFGGREETVSALSQALAAVVRVSTQAETVADLVSGVVEALWSLPGIAAAHFGRPDAKGVFQFEVGAGEAIEAFNEFLGGTVSGMSPTTGAARGDAFGGGPSGRAWRSGEIERSDAYQTDPSTAPWHEVGRRFGFRASASVPLADAHGNSRALINVYAKWPGYFGDPARALLLAQVRQLTERALARLEARQGIAGKTSTIGARAAHLAKLDRGEVTMLYQPIVDLNTGVVTKFEALARLTDGAGLISPAAFLPSFGARELWRLFEVGLDQALAALRAWDLEGVTTGVSVNLPASFALGRLHRDAVVAALDRHGIAPQRLTLEVLESGAIELEGADYGRLLADLHQLGVKIAEDDLGVAYSSLMRIRYVRFDEVKIARELIRGGGAHVGATWGIIHPLANLVHQLGPTVTVEGLESPGLIEAAVFLGADRGQGYAIARPMPAADVPAWVDRFTWTVDPMHPATALGAFATHLVWESRLRALISGPTSGAPVDDSCRLRDYLAADPGRHSAAAMHEAVHRAAARQPGSAEHVDSWTRLADLLGDLSA